MGVLEFRRSASGLPLIRPLFRALSERGEVASFGQPREGTFSYEGRRPRLDIFGSIAFSGEERGARPDAFGSIAFSLDGRRWRSRMRVEPHALQDEGGRA